MSDKKFTKGEWKIKRVYDSSTIHIGPFYDNTDIIRPVCTTCCDDGTAAHLIAAAPEMYELLSDILNQIESADLHGIDTRPIENLLAKARGEQ